MLIVDYGKPRTPRKLIICDTGPLVSAMNRNEGKRHRFAAELLARLGRNVLVPWPILTEVDLLPRSRRRRPSVCQSAP